MHSFFSPAKINFFFHVIGKRFDGYHDIASLLHTVSFGDYLTFTPSQTDQFTIEGNEKIPRDNSNLIIQALELFRGKTGWTQPLHIHLQKNIPMGSGLGGGSSNAATTLWALNAISKLEITKNELQKWSAKLGSDVPFFFSNGCAVCTGRGEIVEDKPPIIEEEIYLILTDQNVNTGKVFSHVIPSKEPIDISKLIADTLEKKYPCINELEKAAFKAYPSLSNRKRDICDHFVGSVFMTGSGGSFVGVGRPQKELFLQYSVVQVESLDRWGDRWYDRWCEDRKVALYNLQIKLKDFKNILPKETSLSVPTCSLYASILRIFCLYRINELSESLILVQDKKSSSEMLTRGILETEFLFSMWKNTLIESLKTKNIDEACNFLNKFVDEKIQVLKAQKKREKEWVGCQFIYDHLSQYAHPNWVGVYEYMIIDSDQKKVFLKRILKNAVLPQSSL